MPVSGKDYYFPENETLMSMTDSEGKITYANDAFVKVSGFTLDELVGEPHSLVRHPDMPADVFSDMWKTLQEGNTWSSVIKNRRKNGDHYWVRANVTPMMRNGKVIGYLSVRTRPADDEIFEAQRLHRCIKQGGSRCQSIHKGIALRRGWLAWTTWGRIMPMRWRLRISHLATLALIACACWSAGLEGDAMAIVLIGSAVALASSCFVLEHQVAVPIDGLLWHARGVAAGQASGPLVMQRTDELGMLGRAVSQAGLNQRALFDALAVNPQARLPG